MLVTFFADKEQDFIKACEKIQRKAIKFNTNFSFVKKDEFFVTLYKRLNILTGEYCYYKTSIANSDEVKVALKRCSYEVTDVFLTKDYKCIAKIEHFKESENIIYNFSDAELPEKYRTISSICEHCGTKHFRKSTYIVQNIITKELKQVGSTCLSSYCNFNIAQAAMQSLVDKFYSVVYSSDFQENIGCSAEFFAVKDILNYAEQSFKERSGYIKASKDTMSTRYDVYKKINSGAPCDSTSVYKDIIESVNAETSESEYIHNLKILVNAEYIEKKYMSLVVSAISLFHKKLNSAHIDEKKSSHVGMVGKRQVFDIKNYSNIYTSYNDFGMFYIYKFITKEGNILIWKTSKQLTDKIEQLKATIKEHTFYKDTAQTILTRCTVL